MSKCLLCGKDVAGKLRDFMDTDAMWCPRCRKIYTYSEQIEILKLKEALEEAEYRRNQSDQENRALREQNAANFGAKRRADDLVGKMEILVAGLLKIINHPKRLPMYADQDNAKIDTIVSCYESRAVIAKEAMVEAGLEHLLQEIRG